MSLLENGSFGNRKRVGKKGYEDDAVKKKSGVPMSMGRALDKTGFGGQTNFGGDVRFGGETNLGGDTKFAPTYGGDPNVRRAVSQERSRSRDYNMAYREAKKRNNPFQALQIKEQALQRGVQFGGIQQYGDIEKGIRKKFAMQDQEGRRLAGDQALGNQAFQNMLDAQNNTIQNMQEQMRLSREKTESMMNVIKNFQEGTLNSGGVPSGGSGIPSVGGDRIYDTNPFDSRIGDIGSGPVVSTTGNFEDFYSGDRSRPYSPEYSYSDSPSWASEFTDFYSGNRSKPKVNPFRQIGERFYNRTR